MLGLDQAPHRHFADDRPCCGRAPGRSPDVLGALGRQPRAGRRPATTEPCTPSRSGRQASSRRNSANRIPGGRDLSNGPCAGHGVAEPPHPGRRYCGWCKNPEPGNHAGSAIIRRAFDADPEHRVRRRLHRWPELQQDSRGSETHTLRRGVRRRCGRYAGPMATQGDCLLRDQAEIMRALSIALALGVIAGCLAWLAARLFEPPSPPVRQPAVADFAGRSVVIADALSAPVIAPPTVEPRAAITGPPPGADLRLVGVSLSPRRRAALVAWSGTRIWLMVGQSKDGLTLLSIRRDAVEYSLGGETRRLALFKTPTPTGGEPLPAATGLVPPPRPATTGPGPSPPTNEPASAPASANQPKGE
ncbi:hypothetical protein AMEJIAPC_02953 [Caulobacter sp. NIBR1757]|nr:hypothetical protein AMEJIAPC_02953 [Caulobacter sp. NIBR1757]